MLADLSSQKEIRALADQFKRKYARLDVLLNNAGVVSMFRRETVDGNELTWAVNHLAYFLLTHLLRAVLQASAQTEQGRRTRIVNVASAIHYRARINFNDVGLRHGYNPLTAYAQSKLANVLFTYELARRLQNTGVTVNAVHPGDVRTHLIAQNGGVFKWLAQPLWNLIAISAQEGAAPLVYLAESPEVEGVTGKYFDQRRERKSSRASYDEAAQKRLWDMSEEMVKLGMKDEG